MDLIDIDKVLDDLELDESGKCDEYVFELGKKVQQSDASVIQSDLSNDNKLTSCNYKNVGGVKNDCDNSSRSNIYTVECPKNPISTKTTVSNVFNSLNDYLITDVKSQYQNVDNCKLVCEADNEKSPDTKQESTMTKQSSTSEIEDISTKIDTKTCDNETSEKESHQLIGCDGNIGTAVSDGEGEKEDELTTSASSITTSSPSSFSSGLSPVSSNGNSPQISSSNNMLTSSTPPDIIKFTEFAGDDSITETMEAIPNISGALSESFQHNETAKEDVPSISCSFSESTIPCLSALDYSMNDSITNSMQIDNSEETDQENKDDFPKIVKQDETAEVADESKLLKNDVNNDDMIVNGVEAIENEIENTQNEGDLDDSNSDLQVLSPIADGSSYNSINGAQNCNSTSLSSINEQCNVNETNSKSPQDDIQLASSPQFEEACIQSSPEQCADISTKNEDKLALVESADSSQTAPVATEQSSNGTELPKHDVVRPVTLDLPSVHVSKTNVHSTAGQTPPASHVTLDKTIPDISPDQQSPSVEESEINVALQKSSNTAHRRNNLNNSDLGKVAPFWIPDCQAPACMQCKQKFSIIKRRHHCRACGKVLCAVCCSQKGKLDFLGQIEARICTECHHILTGNINSEESDRGVADGSQSDSMQAVPSVSRAPNPNNPMEYCSVISPQNQVGGSTQDPMAIVVPVGVLKREGASKNVKKDKNVIFSDGIRPGYDLTEVDQHWNGKTTTAGTDILPFETPDWNKGLNKNVRVFGGVTNERTNRSSKTPALGENNSFIPKESDSLPPIYVNNKSDFQYIDVKNGSSLITRLQNETLKFAVQRNFYVYVKIVKLRCCINKTIINFTTSGMHHVGQDEIIILLELDNSGLIPKDIFVHLNDIYCDADNGYPISELGFSIPKSQDFLASREHGGFLYIRPTFQCLQEICVPDPPFLIGVLIHRWEVPWAKIFPLRLMLRLGAQYRYYPSPHVSFRGRESVYAEIAQTIINFLADFRNYSFTIATIKGMYIYMEDRKTTVLIPRNRYDLVVKALNNSTDYILALGASFSKKADGHLVCMQNMNSDCPDSHTYSTQAINIQGQPRKITGASFLVLNGALKTTSGLLGKCSIVEDGIMVQILPPKMVAVRKALKNMRDIEIVCGPVEGDTSHKEVVAIQWTENDMEFNIGVQSPIDNKKMDGIPSIRVHSRSSYSNANHMIRWTEVFIIQTDEESYGKNSADILKLSEQIAKSTSAALVPFLDLLVANGSRKIGLRAILHPDNVSYEAGSQNAKLTPLYMNALDNELIPILHKQATYWDVDKPIILELIFYILDK